MENNQMIARTGRVQSWIDDPTSRLPVSCTSSSQTIQWKDLMDWKLAGDLCHALRFGAGVAVHLSKFGGGTDNGKALLLQVSLVWQNL